MLARGGGESRDLRGEERDKETATTGGGAFTLRPINVKAAATRSSSEQTLAKKSTSEGCATATGQAPVGVLGDALV